MLDIALEIPLGSLAIGGGGQGDHLADARGEALDDPLDRAALAGGITPFEHHHDLQSLVLDPVLQLHQFVLEAEQFGEISLPVECGAARFGAVVERHHVRNRLRDLELELLLDIVEPLGARFFIVEGSGHVCRV